MKFTGELMKCVMCGVEQLSDPDIESNWRALTFNNSITYYACPDEFPNDDASTKKFADAYKTVINKILILEGAAQ